MSNILLWNRHHIRSIKVADFVFLLQHQLLHNGAFPLLSYFAFPTSKGSIVSHDNFISRRNASQEAQLGTTERLPNNLFLGRWALLRKASEKCSYCLVSASCGTWASRGSFRTRGEGIRTAASWCALLEGVLLRSCDSRSRGPVVMYVDDEWTRMRNGLCLFLSFIFFPFLLFVCAIMEMEIIYFVYSFHTKNKSALYPSASPRLQTVPCS